MADGLAAAEAFDNFAPLRNGLRRLSEERQHWAGIPMPIEGQRLVIEPAYPNALALEKLGTKETDADVPESFRLRNTFWSWRWRCDIAVWDVDGRIEWGKSPQAHHLGEELQTLGASDAWGLEQEGQALNTLGTLVRHRQMKQYVLTGAFLETSRRSGVIYMFRRLKPTIAISTRTEHPRALCALCMHPIGYYAGSWAGAMCPTDDVIAHLMLMRADEAMFWRRCNQHPPYRPAAGI